MFDQRQQPRLNKFLDSTTVFMVVLLLAFLARLYVLGAWSENSGEDRDGYMGIADNLAVGNGYSTTGSEKPTAFRPPLYPFFLTAVFRLDGNTVAIGFLHLLLGIATVYLTFLLGTRLGNRKTGILAAGLVAVDPLLLRYTVFMMTETLFTFLVAALLVLMIPPCETGTLTSRRRFFAGFLFGLCSLCRPTIWGFGGLMVLAWGVRYFRSRKTDKPQTENGRTFLSQILQPAIFVCGILIVVSPWLVRNIAVFGKPIFTTTHGGYTLLLGNNPVFYRDVVEKPWGTVWDGESLRVWQQSLNKEAGPISSNVMDEPARDRWMYRRAFSNIQDDPVMFLRACWLRFRRFWNIAPLQANGQNTPSWLAWGVGIFYSAELLAMIIALVRLHKNVDDGTLALLLLILAFTIIHLFYWSNARMRAPLIPAIAVLAASSFSRKSSNARDHSKT